MAGCAAESHADVPLGDFLREAVIDYDTDEVTRLITDSHDRTALLQFADDRPFANLCAGRV